VTKTMTDKEWQERYSITSVKGKIWKRSELRKRAADKLRSLLPDTAALVRRLAVELLLDDPGFMRSRAGMVPARVTEDAAMEAYLNLTIPGRHAATFERLGVLKGHAS